MHIIRNQCINVNVCVSLSVDVGVYSNAIYVQLGLLPQLWL